MLRNLFANFFPAGTATDPQTVWADTDRYKEEWGSRAVLAARFIASDSTVLDIGCGRMQLRDHLPKGCTYVPADLTKWSDEVHQVNLDKGEFPPGSYDYITILGVLEYLNDPVSALSRARSASGNLVTSYCHPGAASKKSKRRRNLWINDFSPADLSELLQRAGWNVSEKVEYSNSRSFFQTVYHCR